MQTMPEQFGSPLSLSSALGVQKEPEQRRTRAKKDLSKLNKPAITTTIMIRGIPCGLGQERVMEQMNQNGLAGTYDFFYLPRAGKSGSNLGYAFVNFVHPSHAAVCQDKMDG